MSYILNKKVGLTFEIGEKLEAGIELNGQEVKSVKKKQGSLDGSRVIVRGGEAFLIGSFIPAYQPNNAGKGYDPHRIRKLLLSKKQLSELYNETENKHLTINPISLYGKGILIKCEIALSKRKTKGDKREALKKEEADRNVRNASHNTTAWYDYD